MTKHTENHGNTEKPVNDTSNNPKTVGEAEKGSSQTGGTSEEQAGHGTDKR